MPPTPNPLSTGETLERLGTYIRRVKSANGTARAVKTARKRVSGWRKCRNGTPAGRLQLPVCEYRPDRPVTFDENCHRDDRNLSVARLLAEFANGRTQENQLH